ncbi:MAG TPA: AarF/UbiB family protein [Dictyobacter sp.]|jgi:predicted unusual protein kinase regulating ubiquinone biosynthesis (AarF/ABC1/UbiB family)|nr:AarF/UbiB family protein [Dictyobacter sp.]
MRKSTPRINRISQLVRSFRVARLLLWTIYVIYRERRRVLRARERGNYDVKPNIEVLIEVLTAFRQTALQLGVLMIKLGQFLSARADLLPEQALAVLSSLQDEVPPEPFEHVATVIEQEYNKTIDDLFMSFDRNYTAAASLGQVHKAVLKKTGETVAVKIQRPNIEQLVASDLSTMRFVIWVITRFFKTDLIDLWGIFREFRRTVYEEIDFATEAANGHRFQEMFKDNPAIYIPYIYDDYVTKHVLVLEWIDGIKINDYATIDALHIDRLEVAKRTVNAYFYQFFEAGFFHADPHPGNIFIKKDSSPDQPVIAFLDFGMVGTITKSMKRALRDVFLGVVTRNAHNLTAALAKLGFIGDGANTTAIEKALELLLEQYYGSTLGQVRSLEMGEIAQDVERLLYGQPFHIPSQFAFTGRAIGTLVGVSTGLAPNFNFFEVAMPYAQNLMGLNGDSTRETIQELTTRIIDNGRILLDLPRSIEHLINQIESGQVEVKVDMPLIGRRPRRRNGNKNGTMVIPHNGHSSLTLIIMFLASLGGGIYLIGAHITNPGWFCFGIAALTALGTLLRR